MGLWIFYVLSVIFFFSSFNIFDNICPNDDPEDIFVRGLADVFERFRERPCTPDSQYGVQCWDNFETRPEVSWVKNAKFEVRQNSLDSNFSDCRPAIIDEEERWDFVTCENLNWTRVHLDQFPDDVIYLRISRTRITYLHKDSFYGKSIRFLELDDNPTTALDDDALKGLSMLQSLTISKTQISVRNYEDKYFFHPFRELSSLQFLYIEDNTQLVLKGIDDERGCDNITYLHNLNSLSLKGTPVTKIEQSFFCPLRDSPLRALNLRSSKLQDIGYDALRKLGYLEHIDFYDNPDLFKVSFCKLPLYFKFGFLNGDTFKRIGLGGNNLMLLPTKLMAILGQNLETLNLSGNILWDVGSMQDSLMVSGFPYMRKLKNLILEDAQIYFVQDGALDNLEGLTYLDMKRNHLNSLCDGLKLPTLEYLDLSYQCIGPDSCSQLGSFQSFDRGFSTMNRLKHLKMSGLHRSNLSRDSFHGLTRLEELKLDHSSLEHIEEGIFLPTPNLKSLDLSFNSNLRGLTAGVFEGLESLESLNMSFSSGAFSTEQSDAALINLTMSNLKYLNLSCALNRQCVSSYNYSSPLNPGLLKSLQALEILDLSRNGLTSWSDDRFSSNQRITHLFLQDNHLVFLTDDLLSLFGRMKVIDFRNNPITCNVNVARFYQMTLEVPGMNVVGWNGGNGYYCFNETNLALSYTFKEFYENFDWSLPKNPKDDWTTYWTSGFILGSLVMVGFIGFVSYYVYQKRFHISYFFLLQRRKLMEKRDPEMEYSYDVFLSYCQDQQQWVTEELLPALEDKDPKLKCCIHERDFEVGRTVTENIVNGIDKSRKFVMILSKGYVKSKWCLFETHVAHSRMLDSKENNLVLVMKDKIDPTALDKNLRLFLKTWTYLEWSEKVIENKVFLERLRSTILRKDTSIFKLPHRRLLQ